MFTVMFATARCSGWISQWMEMMSEGAIKIGRPRQLYVGHEVRDYATIDKRGKMLLVVVVQMLILLNLS